MRVLIISHMYPSHPDDISGIFVHQQVKELINQGCEVKVISPVPWVPFPLRYFSKKWGKYSKIPKRAIFEGVEVYHPRYLTFPKAFLFFTSGVRMYLGIRKIAKRLYKDFKFDIVHSHVALPDGWAGMKIAKKYGRPLVVTIHGQDLQKTIFINNWCKMNVLSVINLSNRTIFVSNKLKRIAEDYLNDVKNKFIVINNGIEPIDLVREVNLRRNKNSKKIILSVSNLIKSKGIDYNIEAINKLKDKYTNIIYLIIGDGPILKDLVVMVDRLKLGNYVKFLGKLPHNDSLSYMKVCDVFSLPSWDEGFGVVYLEAMAYGKPVIACKGQGIEDVIENMKNGILVEPKNVDSLVDAIDYLLSNPDRAKTIGKNAQSLVLSRFTWKENVKKTIQVYKEVLSEN